MKIFNLFLVVTLTLLLSGKILAQEIGQVVWVKGEAKATKDKDPARILARRSPLFEKDTITTGANSAVEISFSDNTLLTLREDTTYRLDQYKFTPNAPKENKLVSTLVTGGLRTVTGAISKSDPKAYKLNTPVASIGIRGTSFSTFCGKGKGCAFKILSGFVIVSNQGGTVVLDPTSNKYAVVNSNTAAPVATRTQPDVFKTEPPLVSPSDFKPGITPKSVSNFCIS